ncbi:MAG: fluoride efflux transporter CrcB [Proteobacteria bacterium]|nr:fluoride efflux transporter CrcB [Pseudomonadota bacterium]
MNALALAYVAVGGAFGSLCRFALMSMVGRLHETPFPYGTLLVNISGSFLMGLWIGVMALWLPERQKDLHLLIAVGALGGFTTFSTFSLDAFMLMDKGLHTQALMYMLASVICSVLALFAGMALLRAAA